MRFEEVMGLTMAGARALFGAEESAVKRGLGGLIRDWHPDVCADPRAGEALAHITALRARASGAAPARPAREFVRQDGTRFALRPLSAFMDGAAEVLLCERSVSRFFREEDADLARAAESAIGRFRFANPDMGAQMRRFLPGDLRVTPLEGGAVLHTVPRRADQVSLADLIRVRGPFDPRTGAWVVSGLLNIACWAEWAGVAHGAISPETVLVSPAGHETALIGGWEFSSERGSRPFALPDATVRMFPAVSAPDAAPPLNMDLCLIRETAMRLFGVPDASRLLDGSVPRAIGKWIAFPPASGAVADYAEWKSALRSSFGEPKFVEMGVTPGQVYGEQ